MKMAMCLVLTRPCFPSRRFTRITDLMSRMIWKKAARLEGNRDGVCVVESTLADLILTLKTKRATP